jgi:3-hydroxy-3-methylglutaryl CoA synthase
VKDLLPFAAAADLRRDIFTADFANSFGAGAGALRAALDAVNAGSARRAIVVASDCQIAPPNSTFEANFGDGAAALLIGDANPAATLKGNYTLERLPRRLKRERRSYVGTWETVCRGS